MFSDDSYIITSDTEIPTIEDAFRSYTSRNDVGIILINQHVSCIDVEYFSLDILFRLPMTFVIC
jgi:hypothetical protein